MIVGMGYAWSIEGANGKVHICNWAEPNKDDLDSNKKPSPECKKISVRLVSTREYNRLKKLDNK